MLINLSNHNSNKWSTAQFEKAEAYGTIYDMSFPQINPEATESEIENMANEYYDEILHLFKNSKETNNAVHIMGEFTFCFTLITLLKAKDITCLASTTERIVKEVNNQKISVFNFIKFRRY
jgi:hypothetical protein